MAADKLENELEELIRVRRDRDAKQQETDLAAKQKKDLERIKFEEVKQSTIRPALEQMSEMLGKHDIRGAIVENEPERIAIEIFEPGLETNHARGYGGPPCVTFIFSGEKIQIHERTMGGRKGSGHAGGAGSLDIAKATGDDIKEAVMKVVRELLR